MPTALSTATSQADYDKLKPQGAQGPISGNWVLWRHTASVRRL